MNSPVANVLRAGSRAWFKRPTKLWSETYGALPLSYSASSSDLRWRDSNPRPPAYEACTPNRQSVLYRWPSDEEVVRTLLYPVELHPPFDCGVDGRIRTDNRCMPTGSRRGQFQRTQRRGAESPTLLPQSPESVLRRTAVGTRSSSRRDLEGCHYLGRPRIATLGPLMYSQPAVGS